MCGVSSSCCSLEPLASGRREELHILVFFFSVPPEVTSLEDICHACSCTSLTPVNRHFKQISNLCKLMFITYRKKLGASGCLEEKLAQTLCFGKWLAVGGWQVTLTWCVDKWQKHAPVHSQKS